MAGGKLGVNAPVKGTENADEFLNVVLRDNDEELGE
jgi:hypothetical protein